MPYEDDDLEIMLQTTTDAADALVKAIMAAHGSASLCPAPSFGRQELDELIYRKPKLSTEEDLGKLIDAGKHLRSYAGNLLETGKIFGDLELGEEQLAELESAADLWDEVVVPADELPGS